MVDRLDAVSYRFLRLPPRPSEAPFIETAHTAPVFFVRPAAARSLPPVGPRHQRRSHNGSQNDETTHLVPIKKQRVHKNTLYNNAKRETETAPEQPINSNFTKASRALGNLRVGHTNTAVQQAGTSSFSSSHCPLPPVCRPSPLSPPFPFPAPLARTTPRSSPIVACP